MALTGVENKLKCVGVTMFFDLSKLKDASKSTRTQSFYEENCKATLSVKSPLIIFCDSSTRPWIESLRKSLSDCETVYIEKHISEYDFYRMNYNIVEKNRKSDWYNNHDSRNTISYFLLCSFKTYAIMEASLVYPDATHYAWIDFGASHVVWEVKERLQLMMDNPRSKVTVTYIHYRHHDSLKDIRKTLCNGGICGVAGTVFTVEKSFLNIFYSRFFEIFYEQLAIGVGHTDEQILLYMYDRWPELFNLSYGDYYSVVSNYHLPVRDFETIKRYFIFSAIQAGRKDLASEAAKAVVLSYNTGKINVVKDDIEMLYSIIN